MLLTPWAQYVEVVSQLCAPLLHGCCVGSWVGRYVGAGVGQAVKELSVVAWRLVHEPPQEALQDSVRVRVAGPHELLHALHGPYA